MLILVDPFFALFFFLKCIGTRGLTTPSFKAHSSWQNFNVIITIIQGNATCNNELLTFRELFPTPPFIQSTMFIKIWEWFLCSPWASSNVVRVWLAFLAGTTFNHIGYCKYESEADIEGFPIAFLCHDDVEYPWKVSLSKFAHGLEPYLWPASNSFRP